VLKTAGEVAHGTGELGLDTVTPATCGRRVVRFVENQQAHGQHGPEPFPHRVCVSPVFVLWGGPSCNNTGPYGYIAKNITPIW